MGTKKMRTFSNLEHPALHLDCFTRLSYRVFNEGLQCGEEANPTTSSSHSLHLSGGAETPHKDTDKTVSLTLMFHLQAAALHSQHNRTVHVCGSSHKQNWLHL